MNYLDEYYQDLKEAVEWYEQRQRGVGIEFLDELEIAIKRVRESPESFSLVDRVIRVIRLARFPYGVYFRFDERGLLVVGVLHLHRSDRVWKRRV